MLEQEDNELNLVLHRDTSNEFDINMHNRTYLVDAQAPNILSPEFVQELLHPD